MEWNLLRINAVRLFAVAEFREGETVDNKRHRPELDKYDVAILSALVHLSGIMVVRPGIAALAFAGVVILTMFAAESFDARLIWDKTEDTNG